MITNYSLTHIVHISIGALFNLFHEDLSAFRCKHLRNTVSLELNSRGNGLKLKPLSAVRL